MEITADGQLALHDGELWLGVDGSGARLRLARLTTKVQLYGRKAQPRAPSPEELGAWMRLRELSLASGTPVRVIGPLVRPASAGALSLEVRGFWVFSPARPGVSALWVGLDVTSPYGLGEPWVVIREGLKGTGDWQWIAEAADVETATFKARTVHGSWPIHATLLRQVQELGAGAALRGMEAVLEGTVLLESHRVLLRVDGCEAPVALAPLTRKVQWDARQRTAAHLATAERSAHEELRSQVVRSPRRARILGPVVESQQGKHWLMEVRGFELDIAPGDESSRLLAGRIEAAPAAARSSPDKMPPHPPQSLEASFQDGHVHLRWAPGPEPDLDAYSLFRSTKSGRDYIQVAAGVVPNHHAFRVDERGVTYYFVVTARDRSGNESAYSGEINVSIPQ